MAGSSKGKPKSIDDYLAGLDPERRKALSTLRERILSIIPDAEECISYSMPAFRLHGKVVAGFLATKPGASYFPFSGTTLDSVAGLLTGYSRTKSGLHFDLARGVPVTLLRKLIQARLAELGPVNSAKKGAPAKKAAKRAPSVKTARPARK
jgi:uncharacterized protein YdhG (YjbR/CyaY superfamily)